MATQINNKSSFVIRGTLLVLSLFIGGSVAYAGGAFETLENGTPITWTGTVTYRMDPGALKGVGTGDEGGGGGGGGGGGCALHKEEASKNLDIGGPDFAGMVKNAATAWSNAVGGDLVIQEGPVLPQNVNFSNAEQFYFAQFTTGEQSSKSIVDDCYNNNNCLNPIISDPNGLIIDALLGQCSRFGVFGVTSILPQTDSNGNVLSSNLKASQMIIGGTCIAPAEDPSKSIDCPQTDPCPVPGGFSTDEVQNTITHEFGHFLGLDHTLVNKMDYLNCTKTPRDAACTDTVLANNIPTMVGLFVAGAPLRNLHFDDIATIKRYYSNAAINHTSGNCTIKGSVFKSSARPSTFTPVNEWRCEEVAARLANSNTNAAGFVSGAEAPRTKSDGTQDDCNTGNAGCGAYEIRGLQPGTYTMGVHNFSGGNLGDFNIEPCHPPLASVAFPDNDPAIEPPGGGGTQVTVICPSGGVVTQNLFTN
jgi:hypothetical protein